MGKNGTIGIVIALIVLAVVVGVFVFSSSGNSSGNQQGESSAVPAPGNLDVPEMIVIPDSGEDSDEEGDKGIVEERPVETSVEVEKIVEITPSGFSPKTLTINMGDKVTWINKGSRSVWPASANHPTHTIYPEFDSLGTLNTGESYSFTFENVGTWGYHDHLSPSMRGTIVVN